MRVLLFAILSALCLGLAALSLSANDDMDVAIGGYDTVSFHQGGPLLGTAAYQADYEGSVWRFSSAENLALFEADPAAYAPQFDGYCAWAAGQGYVAPGKPEHWAVEDGKLYLQFNARVLRRWDRDRASFIAAGERHWPTLRPE